LAFSFFSFEGGRASLSPLFSLLRLEQGANPGMQSLFFPFFWTNCSFSFPTAGAKGHDAVFSSSLFSPRDCARRRLPFLFFRHPCNPISILLLFPLSILYLQAWKTIFSLTHFLGQNNRRERLFIFSSPPLFLSRSAPCHAPPFFSLLSGGCRSRRSLFFCVLPFSGRSRRALFLSAIPSSLLLFPRHGRQWAGVFSFFPLALPFFDNPLTFFFCHECYFSLFPPLSKKDIRRLIPRFFLCHTPAFFLFFLRAKRLSYSSPSPSFVWATKIARGSDLILFSLAAYMLAVPSFFFFSFPSEASVNG